MTTDIRSAFREIQADESKCAREVGSNIYYLFRFGGRLAVYDGNTNITYDPPENELEKRIWNTLHILADWQVLKLSDVKGE